MTEEDLSVRIMVIMSYGRVLSEDDVYIRVMPLIKQLWLEQLLPFQSGKQWIVGVKVHHRHMQGPRISFIKQGPGKPSTFKRKFVECSWQRFFP